MTFELRSALALLGAATFITGCVSQVTYYNPNILEHGLLQRQFAIDDGYCTAAATGSVPIPQVRIYAAPPSNVAFSGQSTTYNPYSGYSTTTFQGNAYTYPTSSFEAGFANGMNIGSAMAARDAQNRVYHGCMVALGWTTNGAATASTKRVPQKNPEEEEVERLISSIPELVEWRGNDSRRWLLFNERRAVVINESVPLGDYRYYFFQIIEYVKAATAQ